MKKSKTQRVGDVRKRGVALDAARTQPLTDPNRKLGRPATGGRNPIEVWRPRPIDVAAVQLLMEKKRVDKSNVLRLALHHYVDFEGLRDQVEKRAHLLTSVGA